MGLAFAGLSPAPRVERARPFYDEFVAFWV
jgi:hypothetical protein